MAYPLPRTVKDGIKKMLISPRLRFLSSSYAGLGTCLNYHRVTETLFDSRTMYDPNIWLSVHRDDFEEQIRYLSENYRCLSVPEALSLLMADKLPRSSAMVTFDDGYLDNLTVALPILERYGVPATIFVTTGFIDRTAVLWWEEQSFLLERLDRLDISWRGRHFSYDLSTLPAKLSAANELRALFKGLRLQEQDEILRLMRERSPERYSYDQIMMTWDDVIKMDKHPLITIGAHTVNHPILSRVTEEELRYELRESRRILEERLGHPIRCFAYPVGCREHASLREFDASRDAGFDVAFTTRSGHLHARHAKHMQSVPRIVIDYFDDSWSFRWKLSGLESFLKQHGKIFITD